MYTPVRFVNQTEKMISVQGHSNLNNIVNMRSIRFIMDFYSKDTENKFALTVLEWCAERFPDDLRIAGNRDYFYKLIIGYQQAVGTVVTDFEDFLHQIMLVYISQTWNRSKRVYKIESSMLHTFCTMKTNSTVDKDILTKLPNNCFYIDYNGNCPFSDRAVGCFVTFSWTKQTYVWNLTQLIEGNRVRVLHTSIRADYDENAADSVRVDASKFSSRQEYTLEDNSKVIFDEQAFVRFFVNFCSYLYAANNNVTYSVTTAKRKYKKRNNNSQPITELEVGFKRAAVISASKEKVRYQNISSSESTVKRPYSSTYRCAHWHRYWVNDADNPGEKKLILKWVEETFVQGNKEDNSVKVHDVVR